MLDVDRILSLIKEAGHSENSVCKSLKWGNGAVTRWKTNLPGIDKIVTLSEFINVPVYVLLGESAGLPAEFKNKIAAEKFGGDVKDFFITSGRMNPDDELDDEFWLNLTSLVRIAVAFEKGKDKR